MTDKQDDTPVMVRDIFSTRSANALENEGLPTLDDVVEKVRMHGYGELLRIPNFGNASCAEVRAVVQPLLGDANPTVYATASFIAWCLEHRTMIEQIRKSRTPSEKDAP